jgi:hypothetical protein
MPSLQQLGSGNKHLRRRGLENKIILRRSVHHHLADALDPANTDARLDDGIADLDMRSGHGFLAPSRGLLGTGLNSGGETPPDASALLFMNPIAGNCFRRATVWLSAAFRPSRLNESRATPLSNHTMPRAYRQPAPVCLSPASAARFPRRVKRPQHHQPPSAPPTQQNTGISGSDNPAITRKVDARCTSTSAITTTHVSHNNASIDPQSGISASGAVAPCVYAIALNVDSNPPSDAPAPSSGTRERSRCRKNIENATIETSGSRPSAATARTRLQPTQSPAAPSPLPPADKPAPAAASASCTGAVRPCVSCENLNAMTPTTSDVPR